jgi:hypothetical protein
MNGQLLDSSLIESMLTHEAPWCESHGAQEAYVGAGLLYYTLTYTTRAAVAVCLGSGGGFVPRLMRQAQRDAGIADTARTILVDGDVPEAGWGSPQWLEPESFFRVNYPDVELVLARTSEAAELLAGRDVRIDYLHIDADHSFDGCLEDFRRYRPLLQVGSVVTLHDTHLAHAGVGHVLEHLRARADCELVDLIDAGMGTAVLRIVADDVSPVAADDRAAVTIERRPEPPRLDPPTMQWRYLRSEAFSVRNVLAAHFVRDCPTVIELGGWHTPIDRYLTGRHASVVVVDPFIREATREALNGHPCRVRHVRARFQDLEWNVREPGYGLVILGLDLEGLAAEDERTLHELVRCAGTTVIEFPTSWGPSREQYERLLAGSGADVLVSTRLDLARNDFGDLANSWPPRVERELYVLGHRARAVPTVAAEPGERWQPRPAAGAVYGGRWSPDDDGGVGLIGDGGEWASLELDAPLRAHRGFVVEVTVSGEADAAGLSFGPYMDLLTRVDGPPRRLRVEVDPDWDTWSLHVDGRLAPRAWWDERITSAAVLREGCLTLKARLPGEVRFTDLVLRELERPCRLSVVLTCSRFLQRLRLALRTWCAQELPTGSLELLVVNPESPDGTAEHLAATARAWQNVRVREVRVGADLATNKGTMINRGLELASGAWVWIADADCLFPPWTAREALQSAETAPHNLHYLRRRHLTPELTDALLAGRLDPVHDFDRLAAATAIAPTESRHPWGYTQLLPREALAELRYREDVNHFAHTDEVLIEDCRRMGYRPRELTGLLCLHLDHPFAWEGTAGFL